MTEPNQVQLMYHICFLLVVISMGVCLTVIYVELGTVAVVNEGIRLNANGGSYAMAPALGNLYLGAIHGIHGGAGNQVLLILEGV